MKPKIFSGKVKDLFERYVNSLSDPKRKKLIAYAYIILTLLTVSFFGIFAITPTLSTIANLNKQYQDNLLVRDALNKKLSNLKLLDTQYQNVQPDIAIIYNAIPQTTKIPQLTRQLENIASQDNVLLTRLDFANTEIFPNTKEEPIYSFAFTIAAEGSQADIDKFLSDVINFDRIIGIDRIATGTNEEKQYTTEITGRAYFSNK